MTVTSTDLGTTACRSLLRDLDDKPVEIESYRAPGVYDYVLTDAASRCISQQWCVVLLPLPDMISVRAHLRYWGFGIWERAELSPEADSSFRELIFVRYPEDQAAITGPEYGAELRAAVDKALDAIEADRAKEVAGR